MNTSNKINYFINYNALSREINNKSSKTITTASIAPEENELQRIELEKAKTLMKMRYGSKFDLSIDNQSIDNSKFMSDVKVMNKILPDNYLSNNELEFQQEYIET